MNENEWNHFTKESPPIGEVVIVYDSISDCLSMGRMAEGGILETMNISEIEQDSIMDFWKKIEKPSQEIINMLRDDIDD